MFRQFLDRHQFNYTDAARALGVTRPAIAEWLAGTKRPAADARAGIAIWTRGEVYPEAWRTDEEWQALARVQPFKTGTDG